MQKLRTQNGITLIALVITIIVMLILVGVSVTVALNGGLFTTAKEAAEGTASKRNEELELSSGKVEINGEWYNSIDEYVNGGTSNEPIEPENPTISPKKETYTIGETVTIGEESFYVISDDSEKVTLLAKYNLNTAGTAQSNAASSETAVTFSSTNYWYNEETDSYEEELNSLEVPEGVTSIITTAEAYGATKGGTGRLMTYEEAETLATNHSGIIYGTSINATDGYLDYWLGSACGAESVQCVLGNGGEHTIYLFDGAFALSKYGVRPVVEISKSNIS